MPRVKQSPMTVEPKTKPVGKGLGLPKCTCKHFQMDPYCPVHCKQTMRQYAEGKNEKAWTSSRSRELYQSILSLPSDIFIQVERRHNQWQVILVDETLRVTVGYSDLEDTFERAEKYALEQYAKNKKFT